MARRVYLGLAREVAMRAQVIGAIALGMCAACGGEIRQVRAFKDGPVEHVASDDLPEAKREAARVREEPQRVAAAPSCEREAVGVVSAPYVFGDDGGSRAELSKRAAKMGGDAVIDVKRVTSGTDESLLGTAIRCRAIGEGRPYDVLARLDIPRIEGGPEAAFAELRARAWELHADLVLDVHVTEDDANHAHVTGVAIKYR